VNPHTPKATPTLGDGVLVDSQNFNERFQWSFDEAKVKGFFLDLLSTCQESVGNLGTPKLA